MARMFYTLKETAEKLGVGEDEVKHMASEGDLQQFRDGNKLMFKRDQVESLREQKSSDEAEISLEESAGPIPLADSGDTDQIDLSASATGSGDSRQASGISVLDADEVDAADPMAKTQVTKPTDEDELALESVASGSGLLDLTRESDDTSLGAELLEEIYPGGEGSDSKVDSLAGSGTGITPFETAMGLEASAAGATGVGMEGIEAAPTGAEAAFAATTYSEPYDPAGDGMSVGLLLAATIALVVALVVGISALFGVTSGITSVVTQDQPTFWMYTGILLGVCVVFGLAGTFIGKALLK